MPVVVIHVSGDGENDDGGDAFLMKQDWCGC